MADTVNVSGLTSAFNGLAGTLMKQRASGPQNELMRQRGIAAEAQAELDRVKAEGERIANTEAQGGLDALAKIGPSIANILYPQIERSYPERPAPVMMTRPYTATPGGPAAIDSEPYRVTPPAGGIEVNGPTLDRVRDVPITKQNLVDIIAPIAARGGNAQQMTEATKGLLSAMGIMFGNEDTARRGLGVDGKVLNADSAVTTQRADQVHARNTTSKLAQEEVKAETRREIAAGNNSSRETIAKGNNVSRESIAASNNIVRREIEDQKDGTRREIAVMTDGTRRDLGVISDGTRRDIANQSNETRRDIANQVDKTKRDLSAEGTTGSGKNPLNSADAVYKYESLLDKRIDERVGKAGVGTPADRRKVKSRAAELVKGGMDLDGAGNQALDEVYGENPTTTGGGLGGILTGPARVVPDPNRPAATTTPAAAPAAKAPAATPLPPQAPLGRSAPAQAPAPATPAAPAAPAAQAPAPLDEKTVKAAYPNATYDEARKRWVVVIDGKTYGVK